MIDSFENVLIIKLKHLGDVLTTTPLIFSIKQAWPAAKVSYLINPGGEDLVRYHPDVSEVFAWPRHEGWISQTELIFRMRRRRFDLVLELSGGDRGAFLAWTTGARVRVGYAPRTRSKIDRRRLFTHLVTTVPETKHTVEYHLDTLRVLGKDPGMPLMSLFWPTEAEVRVNQLLSASGVDSGAGYVVVHPTSRWMFKAWRPEANAAVIDYLVKELGWTVVITSAPDPQELEFVDQVMARTMAKPVNLAGRLSLTELAALISGAKLFFGVDSLPMHMAAAVQTKAIALFGPSGNHMWGPWGPQHRVIAKDWPCRPCGQDGCNRTKVSRCLVEIEPEEVFPALAEALALDS
ncbi:MAG: putative lipopolysaccharide heptosyltransferase III [Deltaproteobacteria bacterium]|nr:putative lipopolysaccharide heptosyltransferase III [Deltaproteobacteria bacterium]